jgi:hypothetical protein
MMGLWGAGVLCLALMWGAASGQAWGKEATAVAPEQAAGTIQTEPPPEPAKKKEPEPEQPATPTVTPGYFPGILPPSSYGTLDVGPAVGVLAPYGVPAAYDTMTRGWRSHSLGPVRFYPYLELGGIYRSNIFQTSGHKQSDWVNSINPGLRVELPLAGRHRLSAGYLGNYFIYSRFTDQSHYDHNANVDALFNFRGGLTLQFGNAFRSATEEASADTDRQRPYIRNVPYLLATYRLSDRWKVQGAYTFDYLDFNKAVDRVNDYREHTAGFTVYYRFWPKTAALAQYIFTARDYPYEQFSNNVSHSGLFGLTWDPTAKITGTVKVGFTIKDFEQRLGGRDNTPSSWLMSAQTLYRLNNYNTFSLTAQHSLQQDVDQALNNVYRNTGIFFAWNYNWHFLNSTVYAAASYVNNDYLNDSVEPGTGELKRRQDNIFSVGGGISRPFSTWLRLRLDYQFVNKASNFATYSYNEHRVLIGAQMAF